MNIVPKYITFSSFFLGIFIIISFGGNCSNLESEKTYCDKKATHYFLLCMVDVNVSPSYFGKTAWEAQEVQTYAMEYCIAEYNRKQKCTDQKSYRPHRKD